MAVYLDGVFILNFMVDFLLLIGTNRLSGFPMNGMRCAVASLIGGIYGGMCLLPGFAFLRVTLWRILILSLISIFAFGVNKSAVKRCGIFILLSMALGGISLSFGRRDFAALVLAAGGVWLLCQIGFGDGVGGREYVPLKLSYKNHSVSLIALRDSGNMLRDPVSGEEVYIINGQAAERLTGLSQEQLGHPFETMMAQPIPGLRLIPFRSVGTGGGMLLGMRLDQVELDGKSGTAVVAFAPEGIGEGEIYQALVGAN